ncbi:MAG: alpha/beta fold hydrolase [Solobacterium sp.]|nr:alpha/beta fold hydrolase [Solobacterium sp.]
MKKNICLILSALCLGAACMCSGAGCSREEGPAAKPSLEDCGLIYDTNFGGAYADITIEGFNRLGFAFGDSVDMVFSNGYELDDIPYFNGYYVKEGDPVLVGYPGYPHIKMGFNYGEDMWKIGGFTADTTVTITVNEAGKYLDVQEAREITYGDEQGDMSDEKFANYRVVQAGDLKGTLIRSASPCDNQHKRAPVADRLIASNRVNFIINLSDNTQDIQEFIQKDDFNSPYFLSLYEQEKVIPLGLTASYKTDDFIGKLINGFSVAAENDGPYLVHCVEGKDRTGYACMLLEALAGADYQEIVDDYMLTYDNYYDINAGSDPVKYDLIKESNIDMMLEYVCGADYRTADLKTAVEDYLLEKGMKEAALEKLEKHLTGGTMVQKEENSILYNSVQNYDFRMNYFRFGRGEKTMVILPGLSLQDIRGAAEAVAQEYAVMHDDFTVYLFDRRDDVPDTYPVTDMAEDTAQAMKLLGLEDVYLFGASQGGMMAMAVAQEHPELVHSLVIGSSSCKVTDSQYSVIRGWRDLAESRDAEALFLSFAEMIYPEAVYEQYRDTFIETAKTVTDEDMRKFVILAEGTEGFDISDKMDQIRCPVLALEADDDRVLGAEAGELINKKMKDMENFSYYVYSGYGHAAFDTAAPEYQQRMYDFFMKY